ncbi:MAG: hypothetical protein DRO76_02885, partial [Candidatus Altiarchaeales archaeon]
RDERELIEKLEKNGRPPSEFLSMITKHLGERGEIPIEKPIEENFMEIKERTEKKIKERTEEEKKIKERTEEEIDELKKTLRIIDRLIGELTMDAKKKFVASENFDEYKKLHEVVFNYQGKTEQREYVKENTKKVLMEMDKLLEKLPEEAIDKFSKSDDFEQYNKVLEMYGI